MPRYRTEEYYGNIPHGNINSGVTSQALDIMRDTGRRQIEQTRYATEDTAKTIREIGQAYGKAIGGLPDAYFKGVEHKNKSEESAAKIRQSEAETERQRYMAERERQRAEKEAREEAFLDERMPNGRTRREQMYMNKEGYKGDQQEWLNTSEEGQPSRWQADYNRQQEAKLLDMDQRRALIQKYFDDADYNRANLDLRIRQVDAGIADSRADNWRQTREFESEQKRKTIEDVSNLYRNAKDDPAKIAEADKVAKRLKLSDEDIALAKGMPGKAEKGPTADQSKAQTFAGKALAADDIVSQLESKEQGYDSGSYMRALRNAPMTGGVFKNTQDRQYEQAQKEFIAAILRRESGGAITPDEFREYGGIFFPTPGSPDEVIQQKAAARKRAVDALFTEAGPAADPKGVPLYKLPPTASKAGGQAFGKPASKPKYVRQNGKLYKLNEQTGKYE